MRLRIAILGTALLPSMAVAQTQPNLNPAGQRPATMQPATPQQPAPVNPRLKQLLDQWEQKMKSVNSLDADVDRYETDALTKSRSQFVRLEASSDAFLTGSRSHWQPPFHSRPCRSACPA